MVSPSTAAWLPVLVLAVTSQGLAGCLDSPQDRIASLEAQVDDLQSALATVVANQSRLSSDHAAHDEVMVGLLSAAASLQAAHVRIEGNVTEEQHHVDALFHYLEELQGHDGHEGSPAGDPAEVATAQHVGLQAKASIVQVVADLEGGTHMAGTGWVVADHQILTAAHVVSQVDVQELTVTTVGGRRYDATLVRASGEQDLALLDVPGLDLEPLPFGEAPALGEALVAVGHPQGYAAWSISLGRVTALGSSSAIPRFRSDVPIGQGSSGGPVLDGEGRVVCVTIGGFWPHSEGASGLSEGHVHTAPFTTAAELAEHVPIEAVSEWLGSGTDGGA